MTRTRIALATLALFAAGFALPASAATIGFDPGDQSVGLGGTATVEVVVSGLGGEIVSAYDLDILYDSSVVAATAVVFSTSLGDELFFEVFNDSDLGIPGVVDLAQLSLLSDADLFALQGGDTVVLASIVFEAVGVGTTSLDFLLDSTNDLKGRLGAILPIATAAGSIRVEGPAGAIPEPSAAVLFLVGGTLTLARRRRP